MSKLSKNNSETISMSAAKLSKN